MLRIEEKYYITSQTDKNGIITDVSSAFCRISGYSKEELIGSSHNIVRHPDTPDAVFKEMWHSIKSGKIWHGEIKNRRKNGEAYWVDSAIEPIFSDSLHIIGYKSVRFDITDTKALILENEENLELLDEFKLTFETVNSGISFVDYDGRFIDANPYVLNLLGYSKEELEDVFCSNITAPEFREENKRVFKRAITTGKPQHIEKICIRKDGVGVWTETVFQVFDSEKILIALKNIGSYKELEESNKLLLMNSRSAAMGEMTSMISHQWRQPLSSINAILTKMKIKYELETMTPEEFGINFEKIKSLVQHLSKTIDFFHQYSKEKKGEKIYIEELFEAISNITAPIFEGSAIYNSINCNCSNRYVDDRLDQVLLSIYQNASDALIERGTEDKKEIKTLIFENEKNQLVIQIRDTAGGISDENIKKVFEPYFSTKSKNGSGLGLYMSKTIVENHIGGTLHVYNDDKGACFEIIVPILKNKN